MYERNDLVMKTLDGRINVCSIFLLHKILHHNRSYLLI